MWTSFSKLETVKTKFRSSLSQSILDPFNCLFVEEYLKCINKDEIIGKLGSSNNELKNYYINNDLFN